MKCDRRWWNDGRLDLHSAREQYKRDLDTPPEWTRIGDNAVTPAGSSEDWGYQLIELEDETVVIARLVVRQPLFMLKISL